ncbi:MAG: hypothetical protein PHU44_18240 [Syntrophales bacterium]|nr:hypothetical protein [Syntrophales bacterium]MDD5642648.1 hypothetical protein [Syntrophales bacterium]
MKTRDGLISLVIFCSCILLASTALAGESGTVSCTKPGCGYHTNLSIGGGRRSPSVTGYCAKQKKFVRIKIKSWEDYRKPHYCPGGKERLQPIYSGSEVARIPCPKCGNLSLRYQRRLMFD